MHLLSAIALAGAITLIGAPGRAEARTWQVPAEASTIAAAIDSSAAGDVVELAPGVYPESGLVLPSRLTIRAADPVLGATIDAGGAGRIFSAGLQDSIALVGLTLTGGFTTNGGAANFQSCQGLEIRDCVFTANRTSFGIGGALQVSGLSSVLIVGCLFQDNDAPMDNGGGIWLECPVAEITGCTFAGNHAINGGGISCRGADVRITTCVFAGNRAANGAGIDLRGDAVEVRDCLFVGNTATRGGAAGCWYAATPTFVGCTMVENAASDQGGGLYCTGGAVATVERSLLAFNAGGGAVACEYEGAASLACSDVFGNVDGDWVGGLEGQEGIDGNFSLDPIFCATQGDAAWRLAADSPCLPTGSPCGEQVGAYGVGCGASDVPAAGADSAVRLLGIHPNPFNPQATVTFELAQDHVVSLKVYDIGGRLVATLIDADPVPAGRHEVRWCGDDQAGRRLPSGTYIFRLESADRAATMRTTLLK
ncbi:MAG TPA: right-handed parallel beta-helix repeat-containing protein [Candidatus Krumholzibacteria bacterium]|nr:right-handed parallel beta-helix repeat-containing protein [Candidatus Krumholzibacteria bacterium]